MVITGHPVGQSRGGVDAQRRPVARFSNPIVVQE
jgi:hypothetical protein